MKSCQPRLWLLSRALGIGAVKASGTTRSVVRAVATPVVAQAVLANAVARSSRQVATFAAAFPMFIALCRATHRHYHPQLLVQSQYNYSGVGAVMASGTTGSVARATVTLAVAQAVLANAAARSSRQVAASAAAFPMSVAVCRATRRHLLQSQYDHNGAQQASETEKVVVLLVAMYAAALHAMALAAVAI